LLQRTIRRASLAFAGALVVAAVSVAPASAGTQVVSGEDEHCDTFGSPICDFTRKSVDYARAGAPDPAKPILLIDCSGEGGDYYLREAYEPDPEITTICPGTPEYDGTVFSTANFSAIVVGDGEGSSEALNPRTADFLAFFNQGGGVVAFDAADGSDVNLDFLPLAVDLVEESSPNQDYVVTTEGAAALGITDEEINDNCCRHELYAEPETDSLLQVGARDFDGVPMLLFGRVDRLAPVSASGGCATGTEVGVTVTDEPNGSGPAGIRYTIDGGAEQSLATDASGNGRIPVSTGQHVVAFRGVDNAGNAEATANSVTVTCTAAPAPPAPTPTPTPDTVRPTGSVAGVAGTGGSCVRSAFRVRVSAQDAGGLSRVTVRRDSRRLANRSFTNATRASFSVRVNVPRLRAGRHAVTIRVTDVAGNRRTVTRRFRVCQRPVAVPLPRFTG
jgi:hypothetical protein